MQSARPVVLVVDDSDALLDQIARVLEKLGFDVIASLSGEEAVSFATKQDFQLIFMDLFLPGMDGLSATRAIRKIEKEKKRARSTIVAMSAAPDTEACRAAGIDAFLPKPINSETLKKLAGGWQAEHAAPTQNHTSERQA